MFVDQFCYVSMGRKLKVETSSDVPRKFSANFVNLQNCPYDLQTTLGQSLEIFGLEIAQNATSSCKGKKLLQRSNVTVY